MTEIPLKNDLLIAWTSPNLSCPLTSTDPLSKYFPSHNDCPSGRGPYSDTEIDKIQKLLEKVDRPWANHPRWYIVLRSIDLALIQQFDDTMRDKITDACFPIQARHELTSFLNDAIIPKIIAAQYLVRTEILDMEKESGKPVSFMEGETIPYKRGQFIGNGGCGRVYEVYSRLSHNFYAMKRIGKYDRGLSTTDELETEITNLKQAKHRHIVKLIASFTDHEYVSFIMSPKADRNLRKYLEEYESNPRPDELRTFFGCLASALEFLHRKAKIRHKDIKPENILIDKGQVYLCDFGIAYNFAGATDSITTGFTSYTDMYAAPEVKDRHGKRDTRSDMWALGCVFLEMVFTLKRKKYSLKLFNDFFSNHGMKSRFIRENRPALSQLVNELLETGFPCDDRPLGWAKSMLEGKKEHRIKLEVLLKQTKRGEEDELPKFCGRCCLDWYKINSGDPSKDTQLGWPIPAKINEPPISEAIRNSRPFNPAQAKTREIPKQILSSALPALDEQLPPSTISPLAFDQEDLVTKLKRTRLREKSDVEWEKTQASASVEAGIRPAELRAKLSRVTEVQHEPNLSYDYSLSVFFGKDPYSLTFEQCPLSKDPEFLRWQSNASSSVLVLQGNTRSRTHFSWFSPVVADMVQKMKDNGEKAIFHCCQTRDESTLGEDPFQILSCILSEFSEDLIKISPSLKIGPEMRAWLEDSTPPASNWEFLLEMLAAVLERFDRVFVVLDRAHLISGEKDRFLRMFTKLGVKETTFGKVKLLLVAGSRYWSEEWEQLGDVLGDIIGPGNFHSITRDQNDRRWQDEVNMSF